MADQMARPTDRADIFWFTQQPYKHVTEEQLEKYDSGRLGFPNSHFDPEKAHELYNAYHEQYGYADEVGFDGIMSNEHHASYWNMKPSVNLDAAVISKLTKNVKIAMLGNVIAVTDPVRIAEEIAMLDCYSGGRIVSGFVRGGAVEYLQAGVDPSQSWERMEEAHDLILKCWTTPGPFRFEGTYYQYRVINPWVLPMQKPHPDIWFPGGGSAESVIWAARRGHPYMNLGALMGVTQQLKQVYIDTAKEAGYKAGPGNFGYLLNAIVADTDEKAIELGRQFLWTGRHRNRGPQEHMDPPGYQSREAVKLKMERIGTGDLQKGRSMTYEQLQEVNFIIAGSPDTVTRKLSQILDELSPGYLLLCGNDGNMPHDDTMRSIELFGKEVIPALHEVKLKPYE